MAAHLLYLKKVTSGVDEVHEENVLAGVFTEFVFLRYAMQKMFIAGGYFSMKPGFTKSVRSCESVDELNENIHGAFVEKHDTNVLLLEGEE